MHSHILICGEVGVGKSTLISRLIESTGRPVSGFCTKRTDMTGGRRGVYMFSPRNRDESVLLARCENGSWTVDTEAFDSFGTELLSRVKKGDVIVMDELGFMEENAEKFKARVLELLDGDITIIAAVKLRDHNSPFLKAVKEHPNADIFCITEENRDGLLRELLQDPRITDR